MALDHGIVGVRRGPWTRSWTSTDSLTYALGVGAGQLDPTDELAFTTENTAGVTQQALPTYAIVIAQFGGPQSGLEGVDFTQLLHAEQALTVHRPMPVAGSVSLTSTVTDIFDKGKGALVVNEITATDPDDGAPVFTTRSSVFIRGEGGFGGDRGPSATFAVPERAADARLRFPTSVNQALLYRLSGDRNPLHTDPAFAAAGGFDRPILHGLATYGIAVRLLLGEFCDGDASRLRSVSGRFTKPVWPGEELVVTAWADGDTVSFRTANGDGDVVVDHGELVIEK
ncbi:MAG TPA: MaoC/PaaZ C-terminal domain-containing protein [Pseudonocardiaceae bacterium]|jgi:acyl dehydratase|nr:MaoC/PaaZ C-terminal domain-containing protein [Pseudonocardiaceae bacterium]